MNQKERKKVAKQLDNAIDRLFGRQPLIVQGAYGREAKREDWEQGEDFKIVRGPYFSIRDKEQLAREYSEIVFMSSKGTVLFREVL